MKAIMLTAACALLIGIADLAAGSDTAADLPSEVSGELPDSVKADPADPAGRAGPETKDPSSIPATPSDATREAENRRAVSSCVSSRGLPSEACRQRRPNSDVPMSRTEARRLEQRYRTPMPGSARSGYRGSGYRTGRGR